MSAFIHHELLLLLRTIAVGAVLLLCYDLLAAFRNVFAHSDKAVGTEDILYWLCCAFFVFSEIYRSNEGILRFFMVLGFLSGASVYLQQGPRRYFCKMLYETYGDSCNNY